MLIRQEFQFLIVRIRPNQVLLERILNLNRNQQFLQKKLQVKNQLLQLKLDLNFLEEVVKSQWNQSRKRKNHAWKDFS